MIDLYVYYKVRDAQAAHLEPLVRALQARLDRPGAQLKRRPGSTGGLQTWMEVYPGVPGAFAGELSAAAAAAGIDALIEGPRRAEVFVELTPCA
ncbi:MAG: hypothetical protein V7631_2571 [Massilia sp.]|jgi:hypothetical protein